MTKVRDMAVVDGVEVKAGDMLSYKMPCGVVFFSVSKVFASNRLEVRGVMDDLNDGHHSGMVGLHFKLSKVARGYHKGFWKLSRNDIGWANGLVKFLAK